MTCQIILEESDQLWIPTFKTWRLNERHYGALVGKNKDEMAREFGADQVKRWRRDYYEMPPLVEETILIAVTHNWQIKTFLMEKICK